MDAILVRDSVTQLDLAAQGSVTACASPAAIYMAYRAAKAGVRAVVLHDAGVGRDSAGVSGLAWLEAVGIAGCAVDHASARIGDGADLVASGVISFANGKASDLGVRAGMNCKDALARLQDAEMPAPTLKEIAITRNRIATSGKRAVWAMDSVTLLEADDKRSIVVSGSHGGLLGGRAEDGLLPVDLFAAFFNDVGGGKDGAGFARLAVLDAKTIAGATVSAHTARIGDGRSTYDTGVLSRVNLTAERLGLAGGMGVREAVARLVGLA